MQPIQVDGGGQSERVLQGTRLYGMYAGRLGLSVPQPVCSQASRLHTCGPSAQSCLLWHLGCCLLQQHIFHLRHQPHQPVLPPTHTYFCLFLLVNSDTSNFKNPPSFFIIARYFLSVLAEKSVRKGLKRMQPQLNCAARHSLTVGFLSLVLYSKCVELLGETGFLFDS